MAQPRYHILKRYASGVMDQAGKFYPLKSKSFTASGTLPIKQNVRYFIETVEHNATQPVSIAAVTVDKVEITQYAITSAISQLTMPITVAAVNGIQASVRFECDVLTDFMTVVTVTIACATPFCVIRYAEIDEDPGEYQA